MKQYFAQLLQKNVLRYTRSWDDFVINAGTKKEQTITGSTADYIGIIHPTKKFKLERVHEVVNFDGADYVITKEDV